MKRGKGGEGRRGDGTEVRKRRGWQKIGIEPEGRGWGRGFEREQRENGGKGVRGSDRGENSHEA